MKQHLLSWYYLNHWRVQLTVVLLIIAAASIPDALGAARAIHALELLVGRMP